jgi:DNA-binding MarR family transcriptional regulator
MNHLSSAPSTLRDGLITAYVAYEEALSGREIELSVRTVQSLLSSASHKTGSGVLVRCREMGWLDRIAPAKGVKGATYRLGPGSLGDRDVWVALGTYLFARSGGVFSHWLTSPWLLYQGLGVPKCLMLAVIQERGESSPADISTALLGLVQPHNASRHLRDLWEKGFVDRDESSKPFRYRLAVTEAWLEREAAERLLDVRRDQIRLQIERERKDYREIVGVDRRKFRAYLKGQGCAYCGLPTTDMDPIQVEHVPPKHWGGGPRTGFELPVHRSENRAHSELIKALPALRPAFPRFEFDAPDDVWREPDEELIDFLATWSARKVNEYRFLMNQGRNKEAFDLCKRLADLAATVAAHDGECTIINSDTGEVRRLNISTLGFRQMVAWEAGVLRRQEWL